MPPEWRVPATHFYPRPPRGGRPCLWYTWGAQSTHFYPRPPRGGRRVIVAGYLQVPDISIHALREEGDVFQFITVHIGYGISIHALREEGDLTVTGCYRGELTFLSTPSARRATIRRFSSARSNRFLSTPSARRATRRSFTLHRHHLHFYPRPPRGGRQGAETPLPQREGFLSTPSARRATLP